MPHNRHSNANRQYYILPIVVTDWCGQPLSPRRAYTTTIFIVPRPTNTSIVSSLWNIYQPAILIEVIPISTNIITSATNARHTNDTQQPKVKENPRLARICDYNGHCVNSYLQTNRTSGYTNLASSIDMKRRATSCTKGTFFPNQFI